MCVRVGGRAGVPYAITKFSLMDSLPNFLTHGAPLRELRYESNNVFCNSGASIEIETGNQEKK